MTGHLNYDTTTGLCLGNKTSYGEHIYSSNSLHVVDLRSSNTEKADVPTVHLSQYSGCAHTG